ncbi:MAG: hypothetical protein JWQ97_4026 [Phenylobacterium sp.]|nr:hypothetical protein [Phenylobacterium sp.]
MKLALTALVGAVGALAACTDAYPPPPPPGPPLPVAAVGPPSMADGCFRTHDITNHTIGDDRTLYISVNNRDVYRLEMSGSCLAGATSSDPIIMREPPGTPYACRPIDLDISISHGGLGSGGIPTPCIVQSMVRLAPAEVAALPPRFRP